MSVSGELLDTDDVIHSPPQRDENDETTRPEKRTRGNSPDEWTLVTSKRVARSNSRKEDENNIAEVCITSQEMLPKQFQLAKFFKTQKICNITKVKYINPYKVNIQFDDDSSAERLLECSSIIEKGWRCRKSHEVSLSYGTIGDIECDLSEQDLTECLSTKTSIEIVSVKRLMKRAADGSGWTNSEKVRLGFRGSSLPPYIFIYDTRVKVDPFVFPVTQCSKCWRFGHSHKYCPSNKNLCPKCGDNHANCDTTNYKCINCSGKHMSLSKTCPLFEKEKNIRKLMSEFNCTYKKAMSLHVPQSPPYTAHQQYPESINSTTLIPTFEDLTPRMTTQQHTYSEILKTPATIQTRNNPKTNRNNRKNKRGNKQSNKNKNKSDRNTMDWDFSSESDGNVVDPTNVSKNAEEEKEETKTNYSLQQLIEKLKNIVFLRSCSLQKKIELAVEVLLEWFSSYVKTKCADIPIIYNLLYGQKG